jgi:hypothetical protein
MTEEKRGLMARKTSLRNDMMWTSFIGTSDSKTVIIDTHNTELFKYCPVGLTGSDPSMNSIVIFGLQEFLVLTRSLGQVNI